MVQIQITVHEFLCHFFYCFQIPRAKLIMISEFCFDIFLISLDIIQNFWKKMLGTIVKQPIETKTHYP